MRVGQTVFFQHKYLTQPIITPSDVTLRATQDLCDVLKGKRILKRETKGASDMLVDIFKGYEGKLTKINEHRGKMKMAISGRKISLVKIHLSGHDCRDF